MAMYEGRWDCDSCGTKGILGRHNACPTCGYRRPEHVRFYLPEDEPAETDQALLEQASIGPDWVCEWCRASNNAKQSACTQCGAEKGTSPSQSVKEYDEHLVPRTGQNSLPHQQSPPRPPSRKPFPWKIIAVVAVLFVCVCGGLLFVLRPKEVTATVSGVSWSRSIEVEQFKTLTEEDWNIPTGGRKLSQRQEIRSYRDVLDHYETRQRQVSERVKTGTEEYVCGKIDKGNGFFEDKKCKRDVYTTKYHTETYEEPIYRKEPVYDTKYRYEIDRWVVIRNDQASGNDYQPYWPRMNLSDKEREGKRKEQYVVHFQSTEHGKQPQSYDIPIDNQEKWMAFQQGQQHRLKIHLGDVELIE